MNRDPSIQPEPTPSARRVVALAALWFAIGGAVLAAPGCYGRNCEGSTETYGMQPGEGRMLDEDMWESSPQDGTWLWFPRQRYYSFDLRVLSGRTPQIVLPYLSAQPDPSKNSGNYTLAGGNLALIHNTRPNGVDVRNDTCSDYYLRLVVIAAPLPPTVPGAGTDASTSEADAGDGDAGAEAAP